MIKRLQAAGITATAVQNPLNSLADDVAHTHYVVARQPGPVILAAHSFGGAVISEAGTHPAVAALAGRMQATTVEIEVGHLSLITHPDEVTELIMTAVRAARQDSGLPAGA